MIRPDLIARYSDKYILQSVFFFILLAKVLVLIYTSTYGLRGFGEGNDADYYHNHALGKVNIAVNSWAGFLRWLNEMRLYSREMLTFFMAVLGTVVIPFLAASIVVRDKATHIKEYWCVVLILSLYPTLFYYALDIYRDVLMCWFFLLVLYFLRIFYENKMAATRFLALALLLAICGVLFVMRPYLGMSLIASFILMFLLGFFRLSIWALGGLYIAGLNVFYAVGWFDNIMVYRSKFGAELKGENNLGIVFDSVLWFVPTFFKSVFVQLSGFYFAELKGSLLFLIESVPSIAGLFYLGKNWRFADNLSRFLCFFFVIYGTVWLLGNDNMGTAVRLRIFNYIAILLCAAIIYIQKKTFPKTSSY